MTSGRLMRQVVITAPETFEISEAPIPGRKNGELLLAPLRVGICATDLELLDGSMVYLRNGRATRPLVPGHEWVAVVIDAGPDTPGFAVGDHVVGECSIGCSSCEVCIRGDYHQCPSRTETGIMRRPGAMSQFISFPAGAAHVVPTPVPLDDAALIEPTAVAYRAILRLNPRPGETVLVVGAGTLGYLAAALLAGVFGLKVAVAERRPERRARVEALGCRPPGDSERFRYVVEAAGTPHGVAEAIRRLDTGGRAVLVGLSGQTSLPIPIDDLVVQDQEIVGSLGSPNVWPEVVRSVAAGTVRPGVLVTSTYGIDQYGEAIEYLAQSTATTGKLLIAPHASAAAAIAAYTSTP
ncbi:zinc-dependent alcohol dehydrogenase [Phytohabitans kaempferiae]|uniref:Zinc-binding dehydrogenase n=1 Tax=Phytohabitans kaempferiae TaxID=1620943 RepID=A0ABV6MBG3_9ACTN